MRRTRPSLLVLISLMAALQTARPAWAGYEWRGSVESLISAILNQSAATLGRSRGIPPVTLSWCRGTFYLPSRRLICFNQAFMQALARRVGDAAVAYVAAHEYAHHLQASTPGLMQRARGNTLRIELQADCYAGRILGSIPNIRFDDQDIREMLVAATMLGDQEYDSRAHHGAGENRALALRSGLRYAATGQRDNYYDLFCRID